MQRFFNSTCRPPCRTCKEFHIEIQRIHHVAYRCRDAKETVEWYVKHLNMDFVLAIAEDQVPSTKAPDPYMHVFLDAGQGNVLAFFKLLNSPAMGRDENTPPWVQHIAFKIGGMDELEETNQMRSFSATDSEPRFSTLPMMSSRCARVMS